MKIMIVSPSEGEGVPHIRQVTGVVVPALSPVQVYVSGNNLWYRQANPKLIGSSWDVEECYFGNENSYGATFKIVALDGTAQLADRISQLPPKGARSKIVTVARLPRTGPRKA